MCRDELLRLSSGIGFYPRQVHHMGLGWLEHLVFLFHLVPSVALEGSAQRCATGLESRAGLTPEGSTPLPSSPAGPFTITPNSCERLGTSFPSGVTGSTPGSEPDSWGSNPHTGTKWSWCQRTARRPAKPEVGVRISPAAPSARGAIWLTHRSQKPAPSGTGGSNPSARTTTSLAFFSLWEKCRAERRR